MKLELSIHCLPDPLGHHPLLKLRGDWLVFAIGDGSRTGLGEASHSGDDTRCADRARQLFADCLDGHDLDEEFLASLDVAAFAHAGDLVTATAISGLSQALHDLVARQRGVPAWQLVAPEPCRSEIPVYVTINRSLADRSEADYLGTIERALSRGFSRLKCAPFHAVDLNSPDPLAAAAEGLRILRAIRRAWPSLDLRVDLHGRFRPDAFARLLPLLLDLDLSWIEEPSPIGPHYAAWRHTMTVPLAAGELFFGFQGFRELVEEGWVDTIMPDIKHVGGWGHLLAVGELARRAGIAVSPHNPSGPVATLASAHAAAVMPAATLLEVPLAQLEHCPVLAPWLRDGSLRLPPSPGFGLDLSQLTSP